MLNINRTSDTGFLTRYFGNEVSDSCPYVLRFSRAMERQFTLDTVDTVPAKVGSDFYAINLKEFKGHPVFLTGGI